MNLELRFGLLEMLETDIAVRQDLSFPVNAEKRAALLELDRIHTAQVKIWFLEHGWLTTDLVGEDGAEAFFILVQHADQDRAFQNAALEKLEPAVKDGAAKPEFLAFLTDRLRVANGLPQVYGTQMRVVNNKLEPFEIEDVEHLNTRRSSVGLESFENYLKQFLNA
jgi:hypothetical protein